MSALRMSVRWAVLLCALVVAGNPGAAQQPSPARLLVLLRLGSALTTVDPATGKILSRVPTVKDPHEITVSDDRKLAFVSSETEGEGIGVIDLAAQKEVRRVHLGAGSRPHGLVFAAGKLYFTNEGYKVVGRYDPRTDKVDWVIGVGQNGTHMLTLSKDLNTIFAANRGSNSVSVLEGLTSPNPGMWKVTTIPLPGVGPEGIAFSPDGKEVWASNRRSGSVSIIDAASKNVIDTVNLGMKDGNRVVFTPDGKLALFPDTGSTVTATANENGAAVVVDVKTRKVVKRIQIPAGALMVTPDGSRAYVSDEPNGYVFVVDLKKLEITNKLFMGPGSGPGCTFWVEGR